MADTTSPNGATDMPVPKQTVSDESTGSVLSSGASETVESVKGFGSPAAPSPIVNPSKHLDFGVGSKSEPVTPSTPFRKEDSVDYNQFVMDTLLWSNKVRSAFYLLSGIIFILTVDYMLSSGSPLLTVICQLTLGQMALNFLRQAISPQLQQKATWLDSAWTHAAIKRLESSVKTLAALHDKHLSAGSPHKHLIIACSLWLLSMCARLITASNLVLVLYIGAFITPVVYTANRKSIDPAVKDGFKQVQERVASLDRRVKAAVFTILILLLGYRMSYVDLAIAAFVVCVYARSQLPEEADEISKKLGPVVTPLGKTAAQIGGHIGRAVEGAMDKFELTPTPMKKKNA
ncbi:hypothetical protein CEUSTIGMA_g10183.t1 [Chlamydomonas eustigma]|uniref:Reticulon-like protein n=1 Tax=Chlamydomonas eustigma TaxID=1157962 RepID=A0A250XI42_9CHLO|nr:hypothetical protein CEUSTIGMA_g10183.t1 [Chlamydomonas eustigma]|eukprot:GAX82757.1 hypothetical protein CEUSTIGMA_g10183.t1 [Chlamydomonas eustigma]